MARRKARSSSSILGWLLGNYLGCVIELQDFKRLQKTSGHHSLMVRLQDFSIKVWKEGSGHSLLTVDMFLRGEDVLKEAFCFLECS